MNVVQWVQLISSGALVLLTGVLAWATYKYMVAAKKMADHMKSQSILMQKEFEIRLMPLVEEKISPRITGILKPTADLRIINKGFYPVFCTDVEIKLINKNNKDDSVMEHMNFLQWLEGGHEMAKEISFDFGRLPSFSRSQSIKNEATAIMTFNYRSISNAEIHHLQLVYF